MSNVILSFEESWRRYTNGPDELESDQLERCLSVAKTFEDVCQVHSATWTSRQFDFLGDVRLKSLKELIRMASNKREAKKALSLASKRRKDGRPYYPARIKYAEAKLKKLLAA